MADIIEVILGDDQRVRRMLGALDDFREEVPEARLRAAGPAIRWRVVAARPVGQQRRESATALPGEPGQARPVTGPFTTHPADLAAFS